MAEEKHRGQGAGVSMYVRYPQQILATELGVYALPMQAKWKSKAE